MVTVLRCARHGSGNLIMCLPDFEPAFNLLNSGIRSWGKGYDNWLNVASIIIQRSLDIPNLPTCDLLASGFTAANYSRALFGDHMTKQPAVVGLTEGLYAVTDGVHAQYFSSYQSVESVAAANIWPIAIDTRLGVAAVVYNRYATELDDEGNPSTTMLGCQCRDAAGKPPMKIMCGLALKEFSTYGLALDIENDLTFEVSFQDKRTANHLTCLEVEISVQSVRWPATRFTGSYTSRDTTDATCQSKGTCSSIDATIWVAPLCTSGAVEVQQACLLVFTAASCFPYCMAARPTGSGADALVLYNAKDWFGKVHIMNRDCGVEKHLLDPTQCVDDASCSYLQTDYLVDEAGAVATALHGDVMEGVVLTRKWDRTLGCTESKGSVSIMGTDLHQAYGSTADNTYRALLAPDQPFSFAGDITLTGFRDPVGDYFVRVNRLYGNEVNEFTMVNVQKAFPATAPADVPRMQVQEKVDALPLPYAFSEKSGTRHPSVSTQTSVYFAVNPSLAMFKGFASGCYTGGQVWKTQLSALSSYAPIRIWKIDPYVYCPVGDDGTQKCAPGHVDFRDVPGAFTDLNPDSIFDFTNCEKNFSMEVTALEYLNEENIAVTILKAAFIDYDLEKGVLKANSTASHYDIMYLSTFSMALSSTPHNRDFLTSEAAQGQLCAGMRRFPNLGSLTAELTTAVVNFIRPVVSIMVTIPGLIEIWGKGMPCSLNTHGHSILQLCGAEILSLDDFFDSINRANKHYWFAFTLVAQAIRSQDQHKLANIVDGVAYYGAATSSPVGVYSQSITTAHLPIEELGHMITVKVFPYMPSSGLLVSSNPVKMAQFSYQLVSGVVADLIPLSLRIDRNPRDIDAARSIVALFMNRLFQVRDSYYQSITQGILQGCSGISMMIGFTNPWGVLLRKQCEAAPLSLIGFYDLLLAVAVNVPVAKCLCVDATQDGDFRKNVMEKCYYMVPTHMKPMILTLVEGASIDSANIETACRTLVTFASDSVKDSMSPWFVKQLEAADALASSFDYLLAAFDVDAGKCSDFENNAFATVLIPEPYDYFAICATTSICALKCSVEMQAFDEARLQYTQSGSPKVVQTTATSLFFNDKDDDSDMPMKIVTLVQLSECESICGGSTSLDACIAVAGISANSTILVKKYCVPKLVGYSVRSAPTETWNVWGSENWTVSALDIQFTDTIWGDTLVVLRDGIGRTGMGPQEQFVTVHPRSIQQDEQVWERWYSTEDFRLQRLMLAKTSTPVKEKDFRTTLSIQSVFVFPQQRVDQDVYICMNTVVDREETTTLQEDHTAAACGVLDLPKKLLNTNAGVLTMKLSPDMKEFFILGVQSGYVPVVFTTFSETVWVAQIPTTANTPLKLMPFLFPHNNPDKYGKYLVEDAISIQPEELAIQGLFPSFQQFSAYAQSSLTSIRRFLPRYHHLP
jgi:hypothetical protein